jgi:thymidylate synthase (FAD)
MKVEYVDHGGTDLSCVNAARCSFDNVSDWDYEDLWNGEERKFLKAKDVNLINYLALGMPRKEWETKILEIMGHGAAYGTLGDKTTPMAQTIYNQTQWAIEDLMTMATHWVPFTHTMVTLRMSAPVPIRTQAFKHKVGFTESEESRRYISSKPVLFIPESFRQVAPNIKQGSGGDHQDSDYWKKEYAYHANAGIILYEDMIKDGIAPEQARFVLPQGVEVQWIWTGNIAAFARYYNQRTDPHSQAESQWLAHQVGKIIKPLFPISWDALTRSGRTE